MPAFFLSFLAVLLCGIGARDQLILAALSLRRGQRPAALITALACTLATTAIAAIASLGVLALPAGVRRSGLAVVIALAGIELLATRRIRKPHEPTDSLAALGIVVFAHQVTDAGRLLVFALAAATHAPWAAGAGGALGAGLALTLGWCFPAFIARREVGRARQALGIAALLGAGLALLA